MSGGETFPSRPLFKRLNQSEALVTLSQHSICSFIMTQITADFTEEGRETDEEMVDLNVSDGYNEYMLEQVITPWRTDAPLSE